MNSKYQSNLCNLYIQFKLLSSSNMSAESKRIMKVLETLQGNLTLDELCEAIGMSSEEVMDSYMEGEAISLATSSDICSMLLLTKGFRDTFYTHVCSKVKNRRVDKNNINLYLREFIRTKGFNLRIMPADGIQNVCGYLINGIKTLQYTSSEEFSEEDFYNKLVRDANELARTIDSKKTQLSYEEIKEEFNPNQLFELITLWDELQGYTTIDGVPTKLRSLLDVLAYLLDGEENSKKGVVRFTNYINSKGEFIDSEGDDEYEVSRLYGDTNGRGKATEFMKPMVGNVVPNEGGKFYRRERVLLTVDFSGANVHNVQDKRAKKKTYHRLIDMILYKDHDNLIDFVCDTVKYSNILTSGKYNSNTPLFKGKIGYTEVPDKGTKAYEDLINIFDNKIIFSLNNGEETRSMIMNDISISRMLEVSNTTSVVFSMFNYLSRHDLSWVHLAPLYKEFCDKALKRDVMYKDHIQAYKSLRFLKDEKDTYFHQKYEWAGIKSKEMVLQKPKFNSIEEIYSVKRIVDFITAPTRDLISQVMGEEVLMQISPEELADEMAIVCQLCSNVILYNVSSDLQKYIDKLTVINLAYLDYMEEYTSPRSRYSLFYVMEYDRYVSKINKEIDLLKSLSSISMLSIDATDSRRYATTLLKRFVSSINVNLHYCLKESKKIYVKSYETLMVTEEYLIAKEFDSARSKQIRDIMRSLEKSDGFSVQIDTRYNVDEYNLYRTKTSNELVLERLPNDILGREVRLIKNLFGMHITAYLEGGRWRIDSY